MTPGRRCPAPDPHGAESALPNAIPVPTSRPSGRGEVRGNFAQRRWAPNAARPAGSRRGYLLCAARPAARGGAAHERPPRTKGRPPAPRVARRRRGAWPGPLPECPPRGARAPPGRWRRCRSWSRSVSRRVRWAQSGPLRPRPPPLPHLPAAGDMFRPPPARRPRPLQDTPTPRPTTHAPPDAIVDPSAAALCRSPPRSLLAACSPVRPQVLAAASRKRPEPESGGAPRVRQQTAPGTSRDYLPARRRTWIGSAHPV